MAFVDKLMASVEGKGTVKTFIDQCAIFFKMDDIPN